MTFRTDAEQANIENFLEPTAEDYALSSALVAEIASEIERQGAIPFSRFFELALYHPQYGYYTGPQAVFGREGDFITAPLISPFFSKSLAEQVIEVSQHLSENWQILEIGAGNGTMAKDLLLHLAEKDQLPAQYLILEVSPNLRERQKALLTEYLPEYIAQVQWIDTPPESAWEGVILANEVLDALPVERFRVVDGKPYYVDVTLAPFAEDRDHQESSNKVASTEELSSTLSESSTLHFAPHLREADQALNDYYQSLVEKGFHFPDGYESEYCPMLQPWLVPFFTHLTRGVALFIDYGYDEKEYYRPERMTGTLIAHYKHRAHEDFYLYPGLQDLTANVNFTEVATILVDMGLEFLGYTAQAYFLMGNHLQTMIAEEKARIEENQVEAMEAEETADDDTDSKVARELAWFELSKRVQHLIHPEEMGERFKVLAVGKNFEEALQGFSIHDYAHHL
ncbi:hypothetical protein GCM10007162_00330 [Ignatzschineria ureiclastica]|uniref:class I SAM-dependent methyltransferase n=1 Tax=Ignatzschineria ureiclastica TaxID=472582 RepID=UPI001300961E|nr:SAM-dependent methyltransferase [Ignatzschineria ureiclastica]GGZ89631.1 hypothetical protein GCM10007162_00330 [Ignatzschineria ureiclastica]